MAQIWDKILEYEIYVASRPKLAPVEMQFAFQQQIKPKFRIRVRLILDNFELILNRKCVGGPNISGLNSNFGPEWLS